MKEVKKVIPSKEIYLKSVEGEIIKRFDEYQKDVSIQNVFTPAKLVHDILKEVGSLEDKDVLIVANYDIAFRVALLKAVNNAPAYAADSTNEYNYKSLTFLTDVVELNPKDETKFEIALANLNEPDKIDMMGKKFDVVIGNPPYNDGERDDASHKLWPEFIKFGLSVTNKGGVLSFITPSSWQTASQDVKGLSILNDIFKKHNLLYANVDSDAIKKNHFSSTGSTFSWFVLKNDTNYTTTRFNSADGVADVDITALPELPIVMSSEALSIISKFKSEKTFDYHFDHEVKSDKKDCGVSYDNVPSDTFKFKNFHTPAKGGTYKYSKVKHSNTSKPKVMISKSGKYTPIVDAEGSIGYTGMCLVFFSENADNLFTILNSKLFRFIIHCTKHAGFVPITTVDNFPYVDDSKSWTDKEIYSLFNLTDKEIAQVESIID